MFVNIINKNTKLEKLFFDFLKFCVLYNYTFS